MTATILREISLALPSASGIEIIGSTAYVIADDAPFLYLLDAETLAATGQAQLFETTDFVAGRLPKLLKPDLEALTACTWPGRGHGLLLLGSGSAPQRRVGYWVPLPAQSNVLVQQLDLGPLYAAAEAACPPGTLLNIEAAAATETALLLLHRGVGAGATALVLCWPLAVALSYVLGAGTAPAPLVQTFSMPEIAGCPAGFSGAAFADGLLWVTASVENTHDPVLDGEVLGSFVGVVDLTAGTAGFTRLAWADGRAYRGKVEGLAFRSGGDLLLVTDDDAGGSTGLVVLIKADALP